MPPSVPQGTLLLALVVTASLAGCLGAETANDGPDEVAVDTGNATTNRTVPQDALTEVDVSTAIFAPTWQVGRTWTYAAGGSLLDAPFTATVGVVGTDGDSYALATDSLGELMTYIGLGGSLFLDGVRKDSLALNHFGNEVDVFGFKKKDGASYEIAIFKGVFEVTRTVTDIEWNGATSPGLRIRGGNDANDNISITYSSAAGFFTSLQWTDANGDVLLSYVLNDANRQGSTSGFKQWTVKDLGSSHASGNPNYVDVPPETFESDGSGAGLFLRAVAGPSSFTQGQGKSVAAAFSPSGEEKVRAESDGTTGRVVQTAWVADEAGTWAMSAVNGSQSNRADVFIYQIEETTY